MTPSINYYSPMDDQKMRQTNYNFGGQNATLFLKFKSALVKTLRITCLYRQLRSINFDKDFKTYRDYDLDQ